MGYDISDFEDIHSPYGTLEDCQMLIDETHARGMRIIFDLVVNHTSDQQIWFQESKSSKTNPKRDWYFWRPPRYDKHGNRHPPKNWRSQFTVTAWTWDETTQEYYLHIYAPEMPDLNWENEECRKAVYESSMRFWLDRGIDGFRIDTVNKYSKDITFPDADITDPNEVTQPAMKHYSNGPRMREFLVEMNDVFDDYNIFTVGELPNTPFESDVMKYVSASQRQLNMVFNFNVFSLGQTPGNRLAPAPFTITDVKAQLSRWQKVVNGTDAWTTVFLENHDQGRSISRFGHIFPCQGQEIGMTNMPQTWSAGEYKDIRSVNFFNQIREKTGGDTVTLKKALEGMQKVARDHARLPMQWDDSTNAGFTSENGRPWMRVNDNYRKINVQIQVKDQGRLLLFWKRLLKLRTQYRNVFVYGKYELCDTEDEKDLFVFVKSCQGMTSLTAANMSKNITHWGGAGPLFASKMVLSNMEDCEEGVLRPYEGRIYVNTH